MRVSLPEVPSVHTHPSPIPTHIPLHTGAKSGHREPVLADSGPPSRWPCFTLPSHHPSPFNRPCALTEHSALSPPRGQKLCDHTSRVLVGPLSPAPTEYSTDVHGTNRWFVCHTEPHSRHSSVPTLLSSSHHSLPPTSPPCHYDNKSQVLNLYPKAL